MKNPNSIFYQPRTFLILALLATTSTPAFAAADRKSTAALNLVKNATKLEDNNKQLIRAFENKAWAWAFASIAKGDSQIDTVMNKPPQTVAHATAVKSTNKSLAKADGFADFVKPLGFKANAVALGENANAKAMAGVGNKYDPKEAGEAAKVKGLLNQMALDPEPIPFGLPAGGFIASSFQYSIDLTDPFGQQSSLLNVGANMVFDAVLRDWALEIHDSSNTLSLGDFSRTVDAGGAVTYTLNSPVEFEIPFAVPSSWSAGTSFALDTTAEVTAQTVGPVPEPETYTMFLAGLGLIGFVTRQRKGQQVSL